MLGKLLFEASATCMTGGIRHVSPNGHPWEQVTKPVVLWGVLSAGISPLGKSAIIRRRKEKHFGALPQIRGETDTVGSSFW